MRAFGIACCFLFHTLEVDDHGKEICAFIRSRNDELSSAYQTKDVLEAMEADSGIQLQKLAVDGGAVANNFLMQFQANLLGAAVDRPRVLETTALGAAYLAGLAVGYWAGKQDIIQNKVIERTFESSMESAERDGLYEGWKAAVQATMGYKRKKEQSA